MPGNWSTDISDPRISGLRNWCRSEGAMLMQFEDIYPGSRVVDHIRHIWVLFFCRLVSPVGDNSSVFVWEAPAFVFHGNLTLPPNATLQEVTPLLKGYWELTSRIIKGQWWFPNPSEGLMKPGGGIGGCPLDSHEVWCFFLQVIWPMEHCRVTSMTCGRLVQGMGCAGGPLRFHMCGRPPFLTKSWVFPLKKYMNSRFLGSF